MEPKITKTNKGWRVDLPNGDFCYQPSLDFAKAYVRGWVPPIDESPNWKGPKGIKNNTPGGF